MAEVLLMSSHPLQLSVDELLASAREITGVDIVDDEIVEPLTILHGALCDDRAQMDDEGSRAFEQRLLRNLANRLRMARDFQRHPEIVDQPINGPIVVTGAARSGTTKVQKALAASGDFNFLTMWQALNWASVTGEPGEPTAGRIAEAEAFCAWFDERSPETRLGHQFSTHEPEEDGFMSEGCFVTSTPIGYAELPDYTRWFAGQPRTIRFEFQRDVMKYLQWQGLASADRPWVIKCPSYLSQELDLLAVFPDARFVVAHRSPLQTLPSMCKLLECFHKAYGTSTPSTKHAAASIAWLVDAHLANREARPDMRVLDLRFEDIVDDLPSAIERVYDHADMVLSEDARANVVRWEAEHAMHQLGTFDYALDDYGLDEAEIRTTLHRYFELLESLNPEPVRGDRTDHAAPANEPSSDEGSPPHA